MRIDFYAIEKPRFRDDPMLLVCEIAQKAFENQQPALILLDQMELAEHLDELLWSYKDEAFLPHQIAGEEDDEHCPLLLVLPEMNVSIRPLVINLRATASPDGAERVIELIPFDESAKIAARERWKAYAARGHKPERVVV
jgi:DNA polymerase III subunit chi